MSRNGQKLFQRPLISDHSPPRIISKTPEIFEPNPSFPPCRIFRGAENRDLLRFRKSSEDFRAGVNLDARFGSIEKTHLPPRPGHRNHGATAVRMRRHFFVQPMKSSVHRPAKCACSRRKRSVPYPALDDVAIRCIRTPGAFAVAPENLGPRDGERASEVPAESRADATSDRGGIFTERETGDERFANRCARFGPERIEERAERAPIAEHADEIAERSFGETREREHEPRWRFPDPGANELLGMLLGCRYGIGLGCDDAGFGILREF